MSEYTLYGFTNSREKNVDKCLMFYDVDLSLTTFSDLYYKYGYYNNRIPLKPFDFKYILTISFNPEKVYTVKTKNDYVSGMFHKTGKINYEVLRKHSKRDIQGVILYAINIKKSMYFPRLLLKKECIQNVLLSYKQEPIERLWMSVEDCNKYNKINCINSHSCEFLRNKRKKNDRKSNYDKVCVEQEKYQRLKLQNLNSVMLPNKFYTFSDFETSLYDADFQFDFHFKPVGLWFAQGDEWLQHMKKTNFRMTRYNYLYELELNMDEFIIITNINELYDFTKKFGVSYEGLPSSYTSIALKWGDVVKKTKKSGILISPNLKQIIMKYKDNHLEYFDEMKWYISWDIASGAIWNVKAVKNFKVVYKREQGSFVEI
jgi:hypothetical protein